MNKPYFIAEVSSNHHQDLQRCLSFVDTASHAGFDAVKFQLFKIEQLFAPEILQRSPSHRTRKQWELPVSFLPDIEKRCREKKIAFCCTPFYLDAVDELFPYIDFYKIASYELLWNDLLSSCARTGKPVVLSTGMADLDEIRGAVTVLIHAGCRDLTLLHCVSGYPAPLLECNLAAIDTLRREFINISSEVRFRLGWSDHSVNPGVIHRAVHQWNAEIIEVHLDLEGKGEEFKTGHCWLPGQIAAVIKHVFDGIDADGDGRKISQSSESADRAWRADPADGLRPLRRVRQEWKSRQ
jgi:sialic acid synthase SpsE